MRYTSIHEAALGSMTLWSLAVWPCIARRECRSRCTPSSALFYLVLLAQLARDTGARHGLDLLPTTNGRGVIDIFERCLALPPMPSRGRVISFDLDAVSINLDDVPLNEVLSFREENRDTHRRYRRISVPSASRSALLTRASVRGRLLTARLS